MEEQRIHNTSETQRIERRIGINVSQSCCRRSRRRQRNTISSNVIQTNESPMVGEQNFLSSTPYHKVFVFLNGLLVGVLQANVQGKSTTKTLMEARTVNMCVFLLALFIYCLSYLAAKKYSQRLQIFFCIAVISGSLSSVSLLSIILPHTIGYFSFILWAFITLLVAGLHLWKRFRGIKKQLLPL